MIMIQSLVRSLALTLAPLSSCQGVEPDERTEAIVETMRGPDRLDVESTRLLREYTTDPRYLTEWVDHVPESDTVPSPRDFLGYVVGTPGHLTPPDRIVAYFRELERTSGRVRVFSMGRSHDGREMVVAAIGEEALLARQAEIAQANARLADPRRTTKAEATELARSVPPTYYVTAGLHSPELGPPEMVMELAYRLVVSEQEHVAEIRANVLTLITPVLEMDGRARTVDWHRRHLQGVTDLEDSPPRSPTFWGDYTFHDNNRDGLQASQPLTRNYNDTYHRFLPTVSLDLHESVPLLYVSTGTGPYNETIDPITVTEWQWLASYDVSQATKLGLEGVWSWGFYTGWYPGYLLWVTNNHNAVGRFYETFGNGHAGTFERDLSRSSYAGDRVDSRQWYRADPMPKKLRWSMRNNTNYMQTGVLAALQLAARNGETLLFNTWQKAFNSLERGRSEAPFAVLVPHAQANRPGLHRLLWLLDEHRIEVHRALADAVVGEVELAAGDYLVRMDQPYRNFARTLFMRQAFPADADHPPYDDVSWCLPLMLGIEAEEIDDRAVLDLDAERVTDTPALPGTVSEGRRWIVRHAGQANLAGLAWGLDVGLRALAREWDGYPAGSLVIEGADRGRLQDLAARLHLDLAAVDSLEGAETLAVDLPRVALFHTWVYTQDSGWARYTLEELGVPYTLIDKDDLRAGGLRERFDVVLVPNTGGMGLDDLIGGVDPKWSPLAWTRTDEFPSHGAIDSSEDITGGMGFVGLEQLSRFVHEGGLLITLGSAGRLAADSGLARGVRSGDPAGTPGSHVTARVLRPEHPVAFGYGELTHVFHGNLPSFTVSERERGRVVLQYGTKTAAEEEADADRKAGVPVEASAKESSQGTDEKPAADPELCLSGLVKDSAALERLPAILDVPVGRGRVLLLTFDALHRYQNHHDFAFVTNALLFHDDFPSTPTEEEMRRRED